MNVSLIGMSGSGKSSVAPVLAAALGLNTVDTDGIIEKNYGKISDIFKNYGEKRFRDIENGVIKSLSDCKNTVIATGGGCVLNPENVKMLKNLGKVVYLKTGVQILAKRLNGDATRPLIQGGTAEKLCALYTERAALYEAAADVVVLTDGLKIGEVAKKIIGSIK